MHRQLVLTTGVTSWDAPLSACHSWLLGERDGSPTAPAARACRNAHRRNSPDVVLHCPCDRLLLRIHYDKHSRSGIRITCGILICRVEVASASSPRSRALRQRYKLVRAPSSPAHAGVVTELWRVAPRRGPETGKPRFEDRTRNGPLSIGDCLSYQGTVVADESVHRVVACSQSPSV